MIATPSGVYGRLRAQVFRKGILIEDTGWFNNLITDQGLDFLGNSAFNQYSGPFYYGMVGDGTTAPDYTDTTLENQLYQVGRTNAWDLTDAVNGSPPYRSGTRRQYRFNITGTHDISEIGVGRNSGLVFARAFPLNDSNAPITIPVINGDILDIYHEFYMVHTNVSTPFATTISGVPYTGNIVGHSYQALQPYFKGLGGAPGYTSTNWAYAYSGDVANSFSFPSGSIVGIQGRSISAYTPGNHYVDGSFWYDVDYANYAGGIKTIALQVGYASSAFVFDTTIPKLDTQKLTLNVRFGPWSRYTP